MLMLRLLLNLLHDLAACKTHPLSSSSYYISIEHLWRTFHHDGLSSWVQYPRRVRITREEFVMYVKNLKNICKCRSGRALLCHAYRPLSLPAQRRSNVRAQSSSTPLPIVTGIYVGRRDAHYPPRQHIDTRGRRCKVNTGETKDPTAQTKRTEQPPFFVLVKFFAGRPAPLISFVLCSQA